MTDINYCMDSINTGSQALVDYSRKMNSAFRECDLERLANAAEKGMLAASDLYMTYRNLIISLYDLIPSFPRMIDITKAEAEALDISIEAIWEFSFPVYKISMPYLIPNKRRKSAAFFKSALTETVIAAVRQFCLDNHIRPIARATVIFLSCFDFNPNTVADNDNKESAVILNGLNGFLLRDDNSAVCNTIYYARQVDRNIKTEIYIVDSDHDVEILSMIKAE